VLRPGVGRRTNPGTEIAHSRPRSRRTPSTRGRRRPPLALGQGRGWIAGRRL